MSQSTSSSEGVYAGVMRTVMDNYKDLINLNATEMLVDLFVKDVITMEEKGTISRIISSERNKMQYLLDHIILPNLRDGNIEKFNDFLMVMEESENILTRTTAQRLKQQCDTSTDGGGERSSSSSSSSSRALNPVKQHGGVVKKSAGSGGTSSGGVYDGVVQRVMDNYRDLTSIDVRILLAGLFTKEVITLEEMNITGTMQLNSGKMQYILDSVILPSLQAGAIEKYKKFLKVLEESDDFKVQVIGTRLGHSSDFH